MSASDVNEPVCKRACIAYATPSINSCDHPVFSVPELLMLIAHYAVKNNPPDPRYDLSRDPHKVPYPKRVRINAVRLFQHRRICRAWKQAIDSSVQIWQDNWKDQSRFISVICRTCLYPRGKPVECTYLDDCVKPPCPNEKTKWYSRTFERNAYPIMNRYTTIVRAILPIKEERTFEGLMSMAAELETFERGIWHKCDGCDNVAWSKGGRNWICNGPYSCNDCGNDEDEYSSDGIDAWSDS